VIYNDLQKKISRPYIAVGWTARTGCHRVRDRESLGNFLSASIDQALAENYFYANLLKSLVLVLLFHII